MKLQQQRKLIFYIYIALWALGKLQGFFIGNGSLSLLLYIPFTIMTLFFVYKVIVNMYKTSTMRLLSIFFVLLFLYGFDLLLFNRSGQDPTSFLMAIIASLGPVFSFYYFTKQDVLTPKRLCWLFFLFLFIAVLEFYSYEAKMLLLTGDGFEDITNNSAYAILGLFPLLFLLSHRPILQYISLAVVCFYVISCLKRGAILILIILLIWFLVSTFKSTGFKKKLLVITLTTVLAFVGVSFIERFYTESEYFQYRVEMTKEGSSSSRDQIYSTLWTHFKTNDSLFEILVGEGVYATERVTNGLKAHNDWLELLIDCGVFGVIVYLMYFAAFFRDWRKSRSNSTLYAILGTCLFFTFIRTFFSMSFTDNPFYLSLMMGYGLASIYKPQLTNS